MTALEKVVQQLPPDLQTEVLHYAQFLLNRKVSEQPPKRKHKKLRLTWANGLVEFRDKYTALQLQKQSLDWWGG